MVISPPIMLIRTFPLTGNRLLPNEVQGILAKLVMLNKLEYENIVGARSYLYLSNSDNVIIGIGKVAITMILLT